MEKMTASLDARPLLERQTQFQDMSDQVRHKETSK